MSDNIDYAELDKAVNEAIKSNQAAHPVAKSSAKPVVKNTTVPRPHGQFMDFVPRPAGAPIAKPVAHPVLKPAVKTTTTLSKPTHPVAKPAARPVAKPIARPVAKPVAAKPVAHPAVHRAVPEVVDEGDAPLPRADRFHVPVRRAGLSAPGQAAVAAVRPAGAGAVMAHKCGGNGK